MGEQARVLRLGLLVALAAVSACGGGAGSGTTSGSVTVSDWTPGLFQPASQYQAQCLTPRTGDDPYTHQPYPDVQGKVTDQNNWLRSWTHELYYWYDEVEDVDPSLYSTADYFNLMKTTETDADGAPKDRFHFSYPTSQWEGLEEGQSAGYGLAWSVVQATPPRQIEVAYTVPGTPASSAPASLVRGDELLAVDGVDVVNADDSASVETINEALSPSTVGETHTFTVLDPGATTSRTFSMQSADVTDQPVLEVETIPTASGPVGYILYDDQEDAAAESELVQAIDTLKADGVTDLVLDLRYNGGGMLDLASELSYMIAGPALTAGQTFYRQQFNAQYPSTNPVTGNPITPVPFIDTSQGYSVTAGEALPTLSLSRLFVLTGNETCSASEAIVNGLRGVGIEVYQFGSTTCGKPYGFYPQDNCGTTYFSIEFAGVNAQGFGGYGEGFSPVNTVTDPGVTLPGCSVADDFSHALGDPNEAVLAAALAYRAQPGACPAPTGQGSPALQSNRERSLRVQARPMLRDMLILRR